MDEIIRDTFDTAGKIAGGEAKVFTVSEITIQIKNILDSTFPSVWVEGEISNFKHHSSGHMYFTLKDESAELKAVMFRGHNRFLKFSPEDGMKILVQGAITVYSVRGYYQIVVHQMQPAGVGTLYLAFEALKKKLSEEGLFEDERKKPIPKYPFKVGVVTSSTGAAIQDIINVLNRRAPHVEVIIRPTLVQGDESADDIVAAISDFEKHGIIDVLILSRGGGSLEDLWPFNEEKVARAIADCPIPVISAVGHETDFTIADFVADLRAPTPSAAAELVSPAKVNLLDSITEIERRIQDIVVNRIDMSWQQLDALTSRYGFQQPMVLVEQKENRIIELEERLSKQIQFIISLKESNFEGLNKRLISASPKSVLNRGYSIAYSLPERQIVNRVENFIIGEEFGLIMSNGEVIAETKDVKETDSNE